MCKVDELAEQCGGLLFQMVLGGLVFGVIAGTVWRAVSAVAGYVVFHDLPAERGKRKWNVDHVVVGPGGVFVLETKARPRRKAKWDQEENVVIYDGKVLQFPWCYDDWAVRQVEFNAKWV